MLYHDKSGAPLTGQLIIIAAVALNHVIGFKQRLPWDLPGDLERFKQLTSHQVVVMGRKTYESIGKPLPNRHNIVITSDKSFSAPGVEVFADCASAFQAGRERAKAMKGNCFAIGGRAVFEEALTQADGMELTEISLNMPGDTFFPPVDWTKWCLVDREEFDENSLYGFYATYTSFSGWDDNA